MSEINKNRNNCKDVFNAFLVSDATYSGLYEFPELKPTYYIPNKVISFSKAISSKDYNQWIHFYEDDYLFERVWRNPKKYLKIIKRFNGVILPDFSLYRDMPLSMQIWNIYRSRAIGYWLQDNGVKIIPNIRFGDFRTYGISCDGIEQHSTVSIGTYGNIKNKEDREIFLTGLDVVVKILNPSTIVVYGTLPKNIQDSLFAKNIKIVQFQSEYAISHMEVA